MSAIVDTIMVILFVMLLVYIFRGYHLSKLHERESAEDKQHHDDA